MKANYIMLLLKTLIDFSCYCLQSFSCAQILERHVNDCFKICVKQVSKVLEKEETVKF